MVSEEKMMLLERLVVVDEHQPEPAKFLHVLRVIVLGLLPENLERAVHPRVLLVGMLRGLIVLIQVGDDYLDYFAAKYDDLLVLGVYILILEFEDLKVELQHLIEHNTLLLIP